MPGQEGKGPLTAATLNIVTKVTWSSREGSIPDSQVVTDPESGETLWKYQVSPLDDLSAPYRTMLHLTDVFQLTSGDGHRNRLKIDFTKGRKCRARFEIRLGCGEGRSAHANDFSEWRSADDLPVSISR